MGPRRERLEAVPGIADQALDEQRIIHAPGVIDACGRGDVGRPYVTETGAAGVIDEGVPSHTFSLWRLLATWLQW